MNMEFAETLTLSKPDKMQFQNAVIADQFNRSHDYLRISLTDKCNLRCAYCMPPGGISLQPHSQYMTAEEILRIAKIFVSLGVKKIRLTGGEPLLRKDVNEIIASLSKLPVELAITTNGILVNEHIDTFRACGLKSVNISLDTLKKEKFKAITGKDYFDKVISNIGLLLKKNFHVKVNVVLTKGVNDDEICDFVSWACDKNVHVRFIEFMPFDGNNWNFEKNVSYNDIMHAVEEKFGPAIVKLTDGKNDTAKNYCIADYPGTFAIISSITNPFCDTCNRMRLTADGKMKNCLFSGDETDLLSAFRNGEDIVPLIRGNIMRKKALRSGIDNIDDFGKQKNRSMIAIGG
jgi:cyclic pyranopterin phosphate synthase